jgi:hypothetical protein
MALSLLLALFDLHDEAALVAEARAHPNSHMARYHGMDNDQKRRVMAALYDAFYTILEAHKLDYVRADLPDPLGRDYETPGSRASKGMGQALARIISGDLSMNGDVQHLANHIVQIKNDQNVSELKNVLWRYAKRAIDGIPV